MSPPSFPFPGRTGLARIARPVPGRRRVVALIVLCFVQFMLVLDDTAVNVALPSLQEDLGFGAAGLAWVANAYFLAFGGLLLISGRAADLLGRRRVFLAGVTLFGTASLACGIAQQPWQLVTGRFVQGAGAAMAAPAAMAMLTLLFPDVRERTRALGIWGAIAGLGGTAGLVISGALTGLATWRWIFLINLPISLTALALVPCLVSESRANRPPSLDATGAILSTLTPLCLVFGLLQAAETGWTQPATLTPLVLAAMFAAAFVVVQARTAEPLVPRSFLAMRTRAVANGTSVLFAAAFFAMSFLLMLHLQTVLGFGPLRAGLAYLPYAAGILTGVRLAHPSMVRFGLRATLVMSFLISAAGLLLLSGVAPDQGYASGVLPGMLVASLGSGLGFPALAVAAVTGTSEENAGLGSAVLNCVQQIGGAVGLAVLITLAVRRSDTLADSAGTIRAAAEGTSLAFGTAAALLALGAVLAAWLLKEPPIRRRRRPASRSA
jgi:EmrB/QacA subfamily drug resistance transporter